MGRSISSPTSPASTANGWVCSASAAAEDIRLQRRRPTNASTRLSRSAFLSSELVRRDGFADLQLDTVQGRLQQASSARAQETSGGEVPYSGDADVTDDEIAALTFKMYRQGHEYYWRTHAHPNSTFRLHGHTDIVNPRPVQ